jgi:hypothetical protein
MIQPDEHERVLELLRAARRPEAEITPEHVEENLRWLIRTMLPEAKASDALRERVRAMADARRARPPSLRDRLFAVQAAPPWRSLAGAIALVAACVVLSLFMTARVRAQMLARTLAAMAVVQSAHCTGWHINYRSQGAGEQSSPVRMRVEWWYKAPNRYRKETARPAAAGDLFSEQLVVNGDENVWTDRSRPAPGTRVVLPQPALARSLSALDFFNLHGFLHRAQSQKAGRISEREAAHHGRPVQIVQVDIAEPPVVGAYREHWVLYVDPATDRVLRSESRFDQRETNGVWITLEEEVLDQFEYDVPVSDSLFEINRLTTPLRPRPS